MRNMKVKVIAEAAVSSALSAMLILISALVPPLALFAAMASGIPLMYVSCKHGIAAGIASVFVTFAVTFALSGDILSTALVMLTYGFPSVAFGIATRRKLSFFNTVFITAVFVLIGLMGQVMIINGDGNGIRDILNQVTGDAKNTVLEIVNSTEYAESTKIGPMLNGVMAQAVDVFMLYLPAFIIIGAAIYAYGLCMLGIFFMKRIRAFDIEYTRFNMMRAPKFVCVMYILLLLVTTMSEGADEAYTAVIRNISLITSVAVAVCGLSFVDFLFSKRLPVGFVRALIYVAVWFFGFIIMPLAVDLLMLLGVADGICNLRKPRIKGGGGDEEKQEK